MTIARAIPSPGPARLRRALAASGKGAGIAVVAAVVLALVVRLGAIAATPHLSLASDPRDYDRHARSIAAGNGYPPSGVTAIGGPTAIRPPAFPFLLAGVYKVTGDSVTGGRIAQAVLGTMAVGLIALIALELWGPLVAAVAAGLAAIFPPLVIDGMTLLSEPLFVVLELAALLTLLRWRAMPRYSWLIASGVLAGLGLLTRSNGALLLIPLAIAARGSGRWRTLATYRGSAVLLVSALLVVVPWTIRNAVDLHAFIPVTDQDGYTLIGTYNATSQRLDGQWIVGNLDPAVARLLAANRRLAEPALDAKLRSAARKFAGAHLGYLFAVALHNTLRLFNLGGQTYEREVAAGDYGLGPNWAWLMTLALFPVLALAGLGAMTRGPRAAPAWFWALPVLMLTPVMVLATNRTRAPIDPFLLILAAFGLLAAARRIGTARRSTR